MRLAVTSPTPPSEHPGMTSLRALLLFLAAGGIVVVGVGLYLIDQWS